MNFIKERILVFKFIIIIISVTLLFTLSQTDLTNFYLLVYMPLMIIVYLILRYSLRLNLLNRYISYIFSIILAIITVGKVLENVNIHFSVVIIGEIIVSIIGLTFIFERTFQVLIQLSIKGKSFISKEENGISWKESFFLILFGWIIYLLPFLPGNVAGDGNFQLIEFFGYASMTNHHPFLSTIFEGGLLDIGKHLLGDEFGLFFYVVVQLLICCSIYSFCISKISKLGINKKICIAFSIFIALAPYWSFVSETLHKDGMFIAFFALFITLLVMITVQLFIDKTNITKKQLALFVISCLLVCFWRNDGIYMVVPPIIGLIFVNKRQYWKQFVGVLLTVLLVYIGFNRVLLPALNVAPTEKREALSLPVQQTARYMKYYPNEVTVHERKVLKNTFNNFDDLAKVYNPNDADPTKFNLKDQFNVKNYIETWLQMGLRHPGVYIAATFEGTNAYYTPWLPAQTFSWCGDISSWSKPSFLKLHYFTPKILRTSFIKFVDGVASLPFINILLSDPLAIWICLLMALFMWTKLGFKYVIPIIPIFMNLLICIASPINGLIRYSGCIVFATYCLLAYYFYVLNKVAKGDSNALHKDK